MELASRDAPLACQERRAHGCATVARTFSPPRVPGGLCLREGARLDQGPQGQTSSSPSCWLDQKRTDGRGRQPNEGFGTHAAKTGGPKRDASGHDGSVIHFRAEISWPAELAETEDTKIRKSKPVKPGPTCKTPSLNTKGSPEGLLGPWRARGGTKGQQQAGPRPPSTPARGP